MRNPYELPLSEMATRRMDKVVELRSVDGELAPRVRMALGANEPFVWVQAVTAPASASGIRRSGLVVLDHRNLTPVESREAVAAHRRQFADQRTLTVVAGERTNSVVEFVGFRGNIAVDIVLPDHRALGLIVRSFLNNGTRGAEAVIAAMWLLEHLPEDARDILNVSIGNGFAASSVKEVAVGLGLDRGTLRRQLNRRTTVPLTLRRVVDLTKAVYAAILLRTSGASLQAASRAVGFTSKMSLQRLLQRTCGVSSQDIRRATPVPLQEEEVYTLLTDWFSRSAHESAASQILHPGGLNEIIVPGAGHRTRE